MNENEYTVVKVASRNFNVVGPDGPLTDPEGNVLRFKSAGEAKAEIAASVNDAVAVAAEDQPGEAPSVDGDATQAAPAAEPRIRTDYATVSNLTDDDIAAMSRVERLTAAMVESHALAAWRTSDPDRDPCNRPATPVIDWMKDPNSKPARKPSTSTGRTTVARTAEQDAKLAAIITERRAAGDGWMKVAAAVNDAGIPTPRGGPWWDTTVSDFAKRNGLFN